MSRNVLECLSACLLACLRVVYAKIGNSKDDGRKIGRRSDTENEGPAWPYFGSEVQTVQEMDRMARASIFCSSALLIFCSSVLLSFCSLLIVDGWIGTKQIGSMVIVIVTVLCLVVLYLVPGLFQSTVQLIYRLVRIRAS